MTDRRDTLSRRTFLGASAASAGLLNAGMFNAALASPMQASEALQLANESRDELVALLARMIRIRSHTGETAEAAQAVVADYLSALPYRVESTADRPSHFENHSEYMPPSPPSDGPFINVVGHPNSGNGKNIALFAHIDSHTVAEGWSTDPYDPVIRGGRMYGLGTSDDKGGVAAMLVAASLLAKNGGAAPIVISHHGKGGGSRGSLPVFDRMQKAGTDIDAVLYAHPAETGRGLTDIKNVVRGVLDVTLTVEGWRGEQLEIGLPDSSLWSEAGDALGACMRLIEHLRNGVLSGADVNVGKLSAGDRIGSVPEDALAEIRILFDDDHSWEDLLAAMQEEVREFEAGQPSGEESFKVALTMPGRRSNAGAVDWDAPSTVVLRDSIEAVTGSAPRSYPNHYGGDIRFPIRILNAPAFGIGSLGGNFYGPDEWVDLDDLVNLVAILMLTVSGWASLNA